MANGSLSSNTGGEGDIRRKIVEADLVDCIVAMPAQLFFTTGIPVCLWFLSRDKSGKNIRKGTPNRPNGRKGEILFIDARKLGTLQTRVLRVMSGMEDAECVPLSPSPGAMGKMGGEGRGEGASTMGDPLPTSDIGRIVYTFRQWRGEPAPSWWNKKEHGEWEFTPTPGFAKPATIEEIAKHGHVLTPGRYVGAAEVEDDAEPFAEKYPRMVAEVEECLKEGERLAHVIREQLGRVEQEL
jgi:type I restriction enzyme M protein